MGLLNTSYCGETAPAPRGYIVGPQGEITPTPVVHPSLPYSGGALCSTASDLVRWSVSRASSPSFARMTSDRVQAW